MIIQGRGGANSNSYIPDPSSSLVSAYWTKPLIQVGNNISDTSSSTSLDTEMEFGQSFMWRYSAFATTDIQRVSSNRGIVFKSSSITFAKAPMDCACYKPGLLDATKELPTKVGITSLSRAGLDNPDNWPMIRKGGWIALESKEKGFVPNRVSFTDHDSDPATPDVPVGIPTSDYVEGMMVYDNTNKCMKVYTSDDGGTTYAWHCMTTQTCPE